MPTNCDVLHCHESESLGDSSQIMNAVIGLNVVWVFTESVVDLNDWEEWCSCYTHRHMNIPILASGGTLLPVRGPILFLCLRFGGVGMWEALKRFLKCPSSMLS